MVKKELEFVCPHCDVSLVVAKDDNPVMRDQMGRNWHKQCWEAFKAEYNDVLDANDVNGKDEV